MKKIFRIIPAVFVIIALIWGTIVGFLPKTVYAMAGSGTAQNPYVITSAADLKAVNNHLNAWYELGADIDLSGSDVIFIGLCEVPIDPEDPEAGSYETLCPFTGHFDGKGHTISGLTYDFASDVNLPDFLGLFPKLSGATVQNVGLIDVNIIGGGCIGALAGVSWDSVILNCYATGEIDGGHGGVGGLIGGLWASSDASASVSKSWSSVKVVGYGTPAEGQEMVGVGGFCGSNIGGTIDNCYSTGSVTNRSKARPFVSVGGGFCGWNGGGHITNCYSTGFVTVDVNMTECIPEVPDDCEVQDGYCFTGREVYGNWIIICSSTRYGYDYMGGFCGCSSPECWVLSDEAGVITGCFWDTQTSGWSESDNAIGKTTAEMKTKSTFTNAGWDFDTIWNIDGQTNNGYPFLRPPWSFAVITDLHIGTGVYDYDGTGWNDSGTGQENVASVRFLRQAVGYINSNKQKYSIAFVAVLGDISDSTELSELRKAHEILSGLDIPWVPLIGNHDVWPYYGANPDVTDPYAEMAPEVGSNNAGPDIYFNDEFQFQYQILASELQNWQPPDGVPVFNPDTNPNHNSYFQNFAFDYNGYHFIGLDFNDRDNAAWPWKGVSPAGNLWDFSGGTWDWFKAHLGQYVSNHPNSNENIILLAHHPFNTGRVIFDAFSPTQLSIMANFLKSYKANIYAEFAGHTHQNRDTSQFSKLMNVVETNANMVNPLVRIVQISPDGNIDYSKFLPYKGMSIKAYSPVDLVVTDPDNLKISKQLNDIPGASYTEIHLDEDETLDDLIQIPERKIGNYSIEVVPEPGANPTDTYTIEVSTVEDSFGWVSMNVADNVTIAETPPEPYIFRSTERKPAQLTYTGDLNGVSSASVNLSAKLVDENGTPLSGRTIAFEIGDQSASAITDANGLASTTLILSQVAGEYYFVNVYFSGDEDYLPAYDYQPFTVTGNPQPAPTVTATASPLANSAGWNNSDITVTLTCGDTGSGLYKVEYKLNSGEWTTYTDPFVISTEGINTLGYRVYDNAGNPQAEQTLIIKLDKTAPVITASASMQPNSNGWNNTDVTVSFSAADNLSGIESITDPITVSAEGASQNITGEAIDLAGNAVTISMNVNIDKTLPTVSITANPNSIWPPNHKLVDVFIGGSTTDNISDIASTVFKVTDEYKTIEPTISNFNTTIKLEAWREGKDKDGRVYTISVATRDKADNEATSSATVICPHDQGK